MALTLDFNFMRRPQLSTKIFFIAPQRSGTKNFGHLMKTSGLKVFSWSHSVKHDFGELLFRRDFQSMVTQISKFDVFEDGVFWDFDFVRWATFRFPQAKFVYLGRSAQDWFYSLVVHSAGKNPGKTLHHALRYGRFLDLIPIHQQSVSLTTNQLHISGMYDFYSTWYRKHRETMELWFEVTDNGDRAFFGAWDDVALADLEEFLGFPLEAREITRAHQTREKDRLLDEIFGEYK